MTKHLYSVPYTRQDDPRHRTYRTTVIASSADEARAFAAIKDSKYRSTTPPGPRRGRAIVEPEQADGLTQAKAREFVQVDGGRHGPIVVEWT